MARVLRVVGKPSLSREGAHIVRLSTFCTDVREVEACCCLFDAKWTSWSYWQRARRPSLRAGRYSFILRIAVMCIVRMTGRGDVSSIVRRVVCSREGKSGWLRDFSGKYHRYPASAVCLLNSSTYDKHRSLNLPAQLNIQKQTIPSIYSSSTPLHNLQRLTSAERTNNFSILSFLILSSSILSSSILSSSTPCILSSSTPPHNPQRLTLTERCFVPQHQHTHLKHFLDDPIFSAKKNCSHHDAARSPGSGVPHRCHNHRHRHDDQPMVDQMVGPERGAAQRCQRCNPIQQTHLLDRTLCSIPHAAGSEVILLYR